MRCECPRGEIRAIFQSGRATKRWIATGEPVYMVDPGPPKVTITDVVVGEYFIDICNRCDEQIGDKYPIYFEDTKLRGTAPRPSTIGEFQEGSE